MKFGPLISRSSFPGTLNAGTIAGVVALIALLAVLTWVVLDPVAWQQSATARFLQEFNLMLLAPEAIIAIVIVASTLHVAFSKTQRERQDTWLLATVGVAIAFLCLVLHALYLYSTPAGWLSASVWYGMFQADLFSLLVRLLLTLGTFLVLLFTRSFIDTRATVPGEFYIVMLAALLGGMFLAGASDLIMVFVALETLSISSYVLVGYLRGNVLSAEASLKYLLYGGVSTAALLFGFSLLFGVTGTTNFELIAVNLAPHIQTFPLITAVMTVMILAGVAFKLSAAPFHLWTPDVYEGAPAPVTAFLSVVSKIAGFALAIRFFYVVLGPMQGWFAVLAVMAVLSMVIGNFVALTQRNIKRLLAYSTVAHVGYLLLGLVILSPAALSSLVYYLITYLFMNLGAFAVVVHFGNLTGRDDIAAYAGLVRRRPMLALIFSFMLLSLAGIPITAGFFAKFFLFQAVVEAGPEHLWLIIIALLTSTVSLFYYLNVIRLMVIAEPSDVVEALPAETDEVARQAAIPATVAMLVCLYAVLGLGIWAGPFMNLARESIISLRPQAAPVAASALPAATPSAVAQAQ